MNDIIFSVLSGKNVYGTLWGWGFNYDGQLGDGSNTNTNSPVQVGSDTWIMVGGGYRHSLALKTVA
jgi:alpha-tubulin suppressor-like RCC1 family protein